MENKKQVIIKYNATWKSYDELYGEEQNKKHEIILRHLQQTCLEKAIDLGCGTGNFINKIVNKATYLIGIDISKNMLKEAKRKTRKHSWKTSLIIADAENIPIKSNSTNYVFAITLIQNLPNPIKFINEASRILRKKGRIIITALKRVHQPEEINKIIKSNKNLKVERKIDEEDIADTVIFLQKSNNQPRTSRKS